MVRIRESVHGVKAGSQIGKWTVLGPAFSRGRSTWAFVCQCECGRIAVVRAITFKRKESRGCMSCHWWEENGIHGDCCGGSASRLHRIWSHMLGRCYCKTDAKYYRYGGRGIRVCDVWHEYVQFREWALASGYSDDLSIDRIDNDGPYSPGNCRWANDKQQARNNSNNRLLAFNGKTMCVSEWSERTGISTANILRRLGLGWTIEAALTEIPRKWQN